MSSPRVIRHHHKHNLRHRYEIIKTLGQGTYGKVKLAIEKATGLEVAIKSIRKSKIDNEQDLVRIRREIENMSSLCHPHIIGIYEVFENKEKIIIIMEYASGGEVYDYINTRKVLKEEEARKFFRQIVSAINHCHQNGIVHRDLKLENIILDHAGNIKIADFGLSNIYSSNSLLQTFCGSPLYASPEIVNGLPYYGPEVDAWSIGVLLYTLVYGAMPFDGSKGFCKLRRQITAGDYYEPPCPSEASGLIRALLTVNPAKRATLKDVSKHWWTNLGYSGSPLENERIPSSSSAIPYMEQALQLSSDSEGETTPTVPSKSLVPTHKKKGILKNSSHLNSHGSEVESGHSRQSSMEEDEAVYLLEEDCVANETQVNVEIEISNNSNSRHDSGFVDSPDNRNNSCNGSTSEDQGSAETETGSTPKQDVVFDSTKKPKRGILKNKHRYTGSDSGCVMDCSVTVLDGRPDSPEKNDAVFDNSYDLTDIESVLDGIEADLKSVVGQSKAITCDKIHKDVSVGKYQSQDGFQENTELSRAKDQPVLTRRRGILKRHGKFSSSDETKRYSLGSQSSNSSADVLDFSYDSAEESYIGNAKPNPETTDHAYAKTTCTEAFEGQVVNGKTYDVISKFDDVIHKIDLLSDELCDAGSFHDDGSIFDLAEAEDVYKKALEICDKLK